jgi:hypothetical protein
VGRVLDANVNGGWRRLRRERRKRETRGSRQAGSQSGGRATATLVA